jgi:ABC-type transport system involved in multi-copper enzyme maturation permease subunit
MNLNINPILKKEMNVALRGWKLPVVITLFNLMILFFMSMFSITAISNDNGVLMIENIKGMFYILTYCQVVCVVFMTPALTANTVSGERQRGTLEIMLSTPTTYSSIIRGKLAAGVFFIWILIITSMPYYAMLSIFGGVGLGALLLNMLFITVITLSIGSAGIFFSTIIRKSNAATVVTYVYTLMICLGTLIASSLIFAVIMEKLGGSGVDIIVYVPALFNPFMMVQSVIDIVMNTESGIIGELVSSYKPINFFLQSILINIVVIIVFVKLSVRSINQMKSRKM